MCCKTVTSILRLRNCENTRLCEKQTALIFPSLGICDACLLGQHNIENPCKSHQAPNVVVMYFNNPRLVLDLTNGVRPA
jgi:hypothetical protein